MCAHKLPCLALPRKRVVGAAPLEARLNSQWDKREARAVGLISNIIIIISFRTSVHFVQQCRFPSWGRVGVLRIIDGFLVMIEITGFMKNALLSYSIIYFLPCCNPVACKSLDSFSEFLWNNPFKKHYSLGMTPERYCLVLKRSFSSVRETCNNKISACIFQVKSGAGCLPLNARGARSSNGRILLCKCRRKFGSDI